jgi:hypothetical protein
VTSEMNQWAAPRRIRAHAWQPRALAAIGLGDFEEAYRQVSMINPPGTLASHVPYVMWSTLDLVEAAVRTGRHEEAAAHVDAVRKAGVAGLSSRLALLAAGSAAITAPDTDATGFFEEALAIPGIQQWPLIWRACGCCTGNGCAGRATWPLPVGIWTAHERHSNAWERGRGHCERPASSARPGMPDRAPAGTAGMRSRRKNARSPCSPPPD